MALNSQTTQYLSTYGQAAAGVSRFQLLGDLRRMYPVQAGGTLYDSGYPAQSISAGGVDITNMIVRDGTLYSIMNPAVFANGPSIALRLGVDISGAASGSNILNFQNNHGQIVVNRRVDVQTSRATLLANGEAVYGASGSGDNGVLTEAFPTANSITTATIGSSAITGTGSKFSTDSLTALYAGYNGAIPSATFPRVGDLLLFTQGTKKFLHRIASIVSDTSITIFPAWGRQADNITANTASSVAAGVPATTAVILRSGFGSYSRVVSIPTVLGPNAGTTVAAGDYINYYVGNHLSYASAGSVATPTNNPFSGTIQAYTVPVNPSTAFLGNSIHRMAPQTNDGAGANVFPIQAQDIAYYKSFLLYGYGGAVSWSKAGFPTTISATQLFGKDDFPATNISVIAPDDQFVSFEFLGEQLIAMFRSSLWQIQATGSIPEFQFYKLPEPVAVIEIPATEPQISPIATFLGSQWYRPTVSARNSVYYCAASGLMQLTGGTSTTVSQPIQALYYGFEVSAQNDLIWDSSIDSIVLSATSTGANKGLIFRVPEGTWSSMDTTSISATARYVSSVGEANSGQALSCYDPVAEVFKFFDADVGGAFSPSAPGGTFSWKSKVVALGEYDQLVFSGFQFDGNLTGTYSWQLLGGTTPNTMNVRESGTASDFRRRSLYGKKLDDPFVQFKVSATVAWAGLNGVLLYFDPINTGDATQQAR